MKKIITIILATMLIFAGCGNNTSLTQQGNNKSEPVKPEETGKGNETTGKAERSRVLITMADGLGEITVELTPEYAPITVENFLGLVKTGFYDGLTFHRVIEGFMIQGGDPKGDGTGGSDKNIYGEFSANGFKKNLLKHSRGVISMARAGHPDSASSQFFIVHQDSSHLDGGYAAFGKVISGMDVVDKIASVETDENDKPVKPVVIESIKVLED